MERLTMTDEKMQEIKNDFPDFDCPVRADEGSVTEIFCDKVCDSYDAVCPFKEMAKRLKEYEDAEEQGLLLRLPCKVGDTVFEISLCQAPDCNLCKGFERNDNCYPKYHGRIFDHPMYYSNIPKIGKKVFLTKEEAEQALARMESGNEKSI